MHRIACFSRMIDTLLKPIIGERPIDIIQINLLCTCKPNYLSGRHIHPWTVCSKMCNCKKDPRMPSSGTDLMTSTV